MEENEVVTAPVETEEVPAEVSAEAPAPREKGDRPERGDRGERLGKKGFKKQNFKKVCLFCQEKSEINYKETAKLRKFIAEGSPALQGRLTRRHLQHCRNVAFATLQKCNICRIAEP